MKLLENTCIEFQNKIKKIAEIANLTPEKVFVFWCEYSANCSGFDQSAVLFEFVQWYKDKLGGDQQKLMTVI